MRTKYVLASCLLVCFMLGFHATTANGQATNELDNGCKITRVSGNATKVKSRTWWEYMPLPHLNCSGAGHTRLNVDGVIEDTKSISLSYNDFIEFYIDDLKKFKQLTKIVIKSNQLKRIVPSSSDENLILPDVTSLVLTQNKLESIPNEALKSFPNLTTLVLNNNQIKEVRDDDFRFNPKLSILTLGVNPITTFGDAWMNTLNLTGLNLRNCGLTKVPSPMANMSSLLYADLSENNIQSLSPNSFAKTSLLYWLDLAANQISRIDENAFKGAVKLTVLDLSDNLLESLLANTFEDLRKETLQIDLYENPFNCDCSMAPFRQWTDNMKILDASTEIRYSCKNPLRNHGKKSHQVTIDDFTCDDDDVQWNADCGAPQTTVVVPSNPTPEDRTCPEQCTCFDSKGQIYYPPPGQKPNKQHTGWLYWRGQSYPRVDCVETDYRRIPANIPKDVKTIVMSGNRLTSLSLSQLKKFQSLKSLFLKGNNIRALYPDMYTTLPSLVLLHLAYNNISKIDKTHLISFPNLEVIALYHNNLTVIPSELFAYNSKLNRLYLGPNPVKKFNEDFMKTLNLKSISLRNLSLTEIPQSLSKLEKLTYVDLSDNKLTILKNSTFSKCTSLARIALDNNRITTIGENAFNGATALFSIDLSENLLTSLPAKVFANVSQERLTVEMWDNRFNCDCKMKGFKTWIEKRESNDPMTEIRFLCEQPLRMHRSKSNQLGPSDFICTTNDVNYVEDPASCTTPNYAGIIALSVVLTFVSTVLLGIILWRCTFKRRYGVLLNYAKERATYDDDMEELQ